MAKHKKVENLTHLLYSKAPHRASGRQPVVHWGEIFDTPGATQDKEEKEQEKLRKAAELRERSEQRRSRSQPSSQPSAGAAASSQELRARAADAAECRMNGQGASSSADLVSARPHVFPLSSSLILSLFLILWEESPSKLDIGSLWKESHRGLYCGLFRSYSSA